MTFEKRLGLALLALRLGIFIVFLMWGLDKLLNPAHNSGMIGHYYPPFVAKIFVPMLTVFGIAELVLLGLFLLGFFKTFTYGFVLIAHLITTIVSFKRLLPKGMVWSGFEIHQLLYFGSLPLLACCIALFLLREKDTLLAPGSSFSLKK